MGHYSATNVDIHVAISFIPVLMGMNWCQDKLIN